jgi:hypothetical protein
MSSCRAVCWNLARLSFQAGRYQDAIAQSQGALAIKSDLADAY